MHLNNLNAPVLNVLSRMYCKLGQNGNSEILSKINVIGVKVHIVCIHFFYGCLTFFFLQIFSKLHFIVFFPCTMEWATFYERGCVCISYLHDGGCLLILVVQMKSFWVNFISFHIPAQFVLLMLFG